MKIITAILLTLFLCVTAHAQGVGVGTTFDSGYQTAQSSYNISNVNCAGSNRYLVVSVAMLSVGGSSVTGITHNSVALTKITSIASVSGAVRAEMWSLIAPGTGALTVTVTLSAALDSTASATCYTGVHQTTAYEAANTATATNVGAADATVAVTTAKTGDLVVDIVATDDTAITVGANQTVLSNQTGTLGSGATSYEGPTNINSGTITMSWTNVAALATWSIAAVALKPAYTWGLVSAWDTSTTGGSGTTHTLAYNPSVTAGSLLTCFIGSTDSASVSGVADSLSQTWTQIGSTVTANNRAISAWYFLTTAGGANTVTATYSATTSSRYLMCGEYSGLKAIDKTTGQSQVNPGTGTDAVTTGATAATSYVDELVIGGVIDNAAATITAGTGFTAQATATPTSSSSAVESRNLAAAGAIAATWTHDSATADPDSIVVTFNVTQTTSTLPYRALMGVGR